MKRVKNQRLTAKIALQRFIKKQDRLAEKIVKKKHAFSDKQKYKRRIKILLFCNNC